MGCVCVCVCMRVDDASRAWIWEPRTKVCVCVCVTVCVSFFGGGGGSTHVHVHAHLRGHLTDLAAIWQMKKLAHTRIHTATDAHAPGPVVFHAQALVFVLINLVVVYIV